MDQMYLDNVKLTDSNKKWVNIDIRGTSLHTLKHKEAVVNFTILVLPIISRE